MRFSFEGRRVSLSVAVGLVLVFSLPYPSHVEAQPGQSGEPTRSPRAVAPIDLTGDWVSIVSEDWRFRMSLAQKGDWDIIPAEHRRPACGRERRSRPRRICRRSVQSLRWGRHHARTGTLPDRLGRRSDITYRHGLRNADALVPF